MGDDSIGKKDDVLIVLLSGGKIRWPADDIPPVDS